MSRTAISEAPMSETKEQSEASAPSDHAQGVFGKLRYYAVDFGLGLYDFVYGCFFASTKKDQEEEDERWRAKKRRP